MLHTGKSNRASLRPIATALASLAGIVDHLACAAPPITNCDDTGPGSLRASVLAAAEGDTVDLTQLECSKISLTTGAIFVVQSSLTIIGPGRDKLTVDGSSNVYGYSIFFHNGNGTLEIDNLRVVGGNKYLNDDSMYFGGGCISSSGNVSLASDTVAYCAMSAGHKSRARGGAVFAAGNLTVSNSLITDSQATLGPLNTYEDPTYGGALFAKGSLNISRSTIQSSIATSGGGVYAQGNATVSESSLSENSGDVGAGITCRGALTINGSTISGNHGFRVSAVYAPGPKVGAAQPATIRNSTITGNQSNSLFYAVGAILSYVPITISNSTIAFNSNVADTSYAVATTGASLQLDSSIVAENVPADLYAAPSTTVGGTNNLINATDVDTVAVLTQTLSGCPGLEPLANNGGPTRTHALRLGSLTINAGSNPVPLPFDQRGAGFSRSFGAGPDIGALEWNGEPVDHVFRGGFEFSASFCDW